MYSQISTRGTRNVKPTRLFLQKKEYITYYLLGRLGVKAINSLVTFALYVWPRPEIIPSPPSDPYHELINL